jgi:hypothetical protein
MNLTKDDLDILSFLGWVLSIVIFGTGGLLFIGVRISNSDKNKAE